MDSLLLKYICTGFALVSFLITLGGRTVEAATSCYVCNSEGNSGCEDAGRIGNLFQECNLPGQDRCLKQTGPGTRVLRTCAGIGAPATEGCLTNGDTRTCICYSNYCNTADRLMLTGFTATTVTFLSTFLLAVRIF